MIRKIQASGLIVSALFLTACASIKPDSNNDYIIVTKANNAAFAVHDAKVKAEDYCLAHNKAFVFLTHTTTKIEDRYQTTLKFDCK